MRKLIFGSGKVPSVIKDSDTVVVPRTTCDVTDYTQVLRQIASNDPDVVINCAAKTNLEFCEEDKKTAYKVNTLGAIHVLHAAAYHSKKSGSH